MRPTLKIPSACIDFRYIRDALNETEAVEILKRIKEGRVDREAEMLNEGYPAYLTSVGWIGYSDSKVRQLCQEGLEEGWRRFKIKVGGDIEEDIRRAELVREEIGWECELMMDANQTWEAYPKLWCQAIWMPYGTKHSLMKESYSGGYYPDGVRLA